MSITRLGLWFIVATLAVLIVGDWLGANKQLASNQREYVQTVCDIAHNQSDGQSEVACGQAQDNTNTEYICNNINTHCWVEEK